MKRREGLLFLLLLLMWGCEPSESYHYIINNKSDYELTVYAVKRLNYEYFKHDTIWTLKSKSYIEIFNEGGEGYGYDKNADFLNSLDTFLISPTVDSLEIQKDIYKRENWNFTRDKTSRGKYVCTYILSIGDSDIAVK